MPNIAVSVENLSKCYLVGHNTKQPERYSTLRDTIARNAKNLARKTRDMLTGKPIIQGDEIEEFWALNDISFEIKQGQALGIIGRNGAGKSTLLKILSRITAPTKGRIKLNGRIASLLEVGTGFHPELTGRENVFLNGAILGMTRAEIRRKFDEIVDFSGVEQFLDTPVKRYSSGMYVRLAFAVAAHLEPDILIVDEVLAVGDAEFQKKCLTKLEGQQSSGRTVLFVSHNIGAVSQLCNSVMHLQQGRILRHTNDVASALQMYMTGEGADCSNEWRNPGNQYQNSWFAPTRFYLSNDSTSKLHVAEVGTNDDVHIFVDGVCAQEDPATQVGIAIYSTDGNLLFWSFTTDLKEHWCRITRGNNSLKLTIPRALLNEGTYRIELGIALYHRQWICEPGHNSPSLSLKVSGSFDCSPYWNSKRPGLLAPRLQWKRREA